jgi:hypothetical protein
MFVSATAAWAISSAQRRMVASRPMTGATSVRAEVPRMAITLGKRKRAHPSLHDVAQAERAAVTTLAETLRQLAAGLPEESPLAAEFVSVARSIDVAGVLGTWRLERLAAESG